MRKRDNKFYPLIYAIGGFIYSALAGILDFFATPTESPWVSLSFVVPLIIFSVFTMIICTIKIKDVRSKDIYIPPIVFSAFFLVAFYGLTFIYPDMFLRRIYWSLLVLYIFTAISISIITVIPKIPRKRFVILSYLGVIISALYGIVYAVYNCFVPFVVKNSLLDILLIIRENLIG